MTLILKNPRARIASATIRRQDLGTMENYWLFVKWEGIRSSPPEPCKTIRSAKMLFATHFLQPKYHGKNIWEEVSE